MPLTSLVAAVGMALGGPSFDAAQIPFGFLYALMGVIGYTTGALLGKTRRVAWLAGLITLFSGFFMPYWTTTATFAPFGVVGSMCLLALGLGRRTGDWRAFAAAGALAGLAHLTRADGLLFVLVLALVALWGNGPHPRPLSPEPPQKGPRFAVEGIPCGDAAGDLPSTARGEGPGVRVLGQGVRLLAAGLLAYTLDHGALVRPQPECRSASCYRRAGWTRRGCAATTRSPITRRAFPFRVFWAGARSNILRSRWEAVVQNLQRFVAEQGLVVLAPLLLIGLWRRRLTRC